MDKAKVPEGRINVPYFPENVKADAIGQKIKNGSAIEIGKSAAIWTIKVDRHFNTFQKFMIKHCFGFSVRDIRE